MSHRAHSFERSARAVVDKYAIPDRHSRRLFVELGALLDGELTGLELVVIQRAYQEMYKTIEDVYRPRSPLEAQLEYDRATKYLKDLGIEHEADWNAGADPEILERWARWVDAGHAT